MANPTTNFGWVMPTSTSLVTNLPADFNTFGQAVDTSMSELLGGTTGQVLSKTSNTNMDFTWVTPTDQTPLTTKGDLFTFSTVDARLGVGTNGQLLTADSTAATGLAWTTVSTTPTFVGCSVTRTNTSTSLTNGALYTVAFTGENYDTNSFHDNSTNNSRITIPTGKGGKYYVNAFYNNALGSVGSYSVIYIYLNGSQIAQGYREGNIWRGNGDPQGNASAVLTLAAGDYIEMGFQQGNTETVNMWFIMSATYLGA